MNFLTLDNTVDLAKLVELQAYLNSTNNGYTRKEYLSADLLEQVAHLETLGNCITTETHVYTPFGYECAMKGHEG
jgi:hypothetical protein